MHIEGFLHNLLSVVMHKKRVVTLSLLVCGLLRTKKLSVTGLGRGIPLAIQERSGIRRADRFLGNKKLSGELKAIAGRQIACLIGTRKHPKLIADWSHIPNTRYHVLRMALVATGRALTLYEEVYDEKKLGNAALEKRFLKRLKELLPVDCRPIILTDAGFRNPWFKKIIELNWDYVGRIRGTHTFYDGTRWIDCKKLLRSATTVGRYVGKRMLCKENSILTHLYLIKEKGKRGRNKKNNYIKKDGKREQTNYRRSAKEPWLLASSLSGENFLKIKRVIKLYKMRMQIEEGFRDLKSAKYGFGLREAHSRKRERIRILLLIAMLAALVAWLVGWIAEKNKWQFHFQVNSVKKKRILSLFFLGCQVIKRNREITLEALESAVQQVRRSFA